MYSKPSAGCCGLIEFYDLDGVTVRELKEAEIDKGFCYSLATTSVENMPKVTKVLRARKFKVLATFKNCLTGNRVTLWGKKLK